MKLLTVADTKMSVICCKRKSQESTLDILNIRIQSIYHAKEMEKSCYARTPTPKERKISIEQNVIHCNRCGYKQAFF